MTPETKYGSAGEAVWDSRARVVEMTPDAEITSTAVRMIRDHGADAAGRAAFQAAKLWNDGDRDGSALWRVIATTIRSLQASAPPPH